jgi:dienelactone hydrolase
MLVVSDVNTDDGRSHPPTTRRRRWWLWAGAAVLVLLAVAAGGFYLWATTTSDPGPRAVAALDSDEQVQVIEDDGYTFQPTRPTPVGFIFYPGGRVDPASYAAPAREIAEAGVLVIVPELTKNLAVLDADAADNVIAAHPEIEQWVIGGHSLGGTIAASYAGEHRDTISGLVLWAAYPSNRTDLSTLDAAVASAFGTRDGLTTLDDIDDSRNRLPAATNFVSIEGGNHAQFGDYGTQDGDNPATISREEQQAQAIQASLRILNAAK